MNTVIFLDFDGVLVTHRTIVANGGVPRATGGLNKRFFDETAIKLISGIARVCKGGIVLTSTWRGHKPHVEIAKDLGLPIIGITPYINENTTPRGIEIQAWLDSHSEVSNYVIIDDEDDMLLGHRPRFVKVDEHEGVTWKDALKICEILGVNIWEVNKPS